MLMYCEGNSEQHAVNVHEKFVFLWRIRKLSCICGESNIQINEIINSGRDNRSFDGQKYSPKIQFCI